MKPKDRAEEHRMKAPQTFAKHTRLRLPKIAISMTENISKMENYSFWKLVEAGTYK